MVKTAVVILNWNGLTFLQRFLPGIVRNTTLSDSEIIVADNGSTDDSVSWVRQNLPDASIIEMQENLGFAGGYNKALQELEADYFVLLNSDVEVPPGWLEPIIHFMEAHPQAGACMPKIKALANKDFFEYAGAAGGFIDIYGYPFCRGRIFNQTEKDTGQYDQDIPVFWASGACFVIRAFLYFEAGGLDPDFFAHMEEIDLSWRIQCLGYQVYALTGSEVYHVGGGSLDSQHPRKTFLNFRNNLFLLVKNLPGKLLWRKLPVRLLLDGIAAIKFLAGFEFNHFWAVVKAHFSFYAHLRMMLRKRKAQCIGKELPGTVYVHNITWQFFIHRIKKFADLPGITP